MKQESYFSTYSERLMMPRRAWVKLGSLTLAVLRIIFFNPMTKVLWLGQPHHSWILLAWGTVSSRNVLKSTLRQIWGLTWSLGLMSLHTSEFLSVSSRGLNLKKKVEQGLNSWLFFYVLRLRPLPLHTFLPVWGPNATWPCALTRPAVITASACFQEAVFSVADPVFFCSP